MATGLDNLKQVWLNNTKGSGTRWQQRFASEEARQDWADKLEAKFGIPASTILASGMGQKFAKMQQAKTAADFDNAINEKAAERWARNLRRALTKA